MKPTLSQLSESIQASGYQAILAVAGGGSGAVHQLLSHPGASRFVLDVRIPYSPAALADFLGETTEQACSAETAAKMAKRAWAMNPADQPLGVSSTAALQTNRARRGDDRAFVCIKTTGAEMLFRLDFLEASRAEQETRLSLALLNLLAEAVGCESSNWPEGVECSPL